MLRQNPWPKARVHSRSSFFRNATGCLDFAGFCFNLGAGKFV